MNFASDNITGAAPEILDAIQAGNDGALLPYGNDDVTRAAEDKVAQVFETEAEVFFVATGTAANALAISAATPPWGVIFCHAGAHINDTEAAAPEFFSGGAKLIAIDGDDGKITAAALEAAISDATMSNVVLRSSGVGYQHVNDTSDLAGLMEPYFDALVDVWTNRSYQIASYIIQGFYPPIVSQELVDTTHRWLDAHPVVPALRRLVIEQLAGVERALKAQERDSQAQ